MALFRRQPDEAERVLLQASPPLTYRAIILNVRLYRWDRALDIAIKFRSHVDTVLGYRQKYLEQFGKKENNQRFIQYSSQVQVNWEAIQAKEEKEVEDEKHRVGGSSGKASRK